MECVHAVQVFMVAVVITLGCVVLFPWMSSSFVGLVLLKSCLKLFVRSAKVFALVCSKNTVVLLS